MKNEQQTRPPYLPHTVLVDREAVDDPMTRRVLDRLPGVKTHVIDGKGDPITERNLFTEQIQGMSEAERFSFGKRVLLLTRYHGSWLKACPGTSGHVCCNLWIVNPGEGCPLDCTYCYLQSYLSRNPTLKIYTNTDSLIAAIEERARLQPNRLFRVGTGEVIDSLIWDDLTDLSCELVPFFARMPNLVLELKTKSAQIENLLRMKDAHAGKTVVSWSMNAAPVTEKDEAFTASLSERIEAAAAVVECGYRVAFHFDPLIHFQGWEDEYRATIEWIFSRIPKENIAWVSVSSLRYQPEMQDVIRERFPKSKIPFGEQFLAKDRKLRYVQPIRFRMLQLVWDELKRRGASEISSPSGDATNVTSMALPVYMCMESPAAWRTVANGLPVAGSELTEVFSRRGKLPILNQGESSF